MMFFRKDPEGYRDIEPEEAKALMDRGGVSVIDVREPGEFAAGHIAGAVNIPLGTIRKGVLLDEFPDTGRTLLVYCRSGRRSGIAGRILAETGYSDVRNFGGVLQWPYGLVRD
jgi:rhodanese-related sulfurtransferase